jgi:hypothetical protein
MNVKTAVITHHLCNFACWEAREDVCRCECGGKNHGILKRDPGMVLPKRRSKINDHIYNLLAVMTDQAYYLAEQINRQDGPWKIDELTDWQGKPITYRHWWRDNDPGAPCRVKRASKDQQARWPELEPYRNLPRYKGLYLVWLRQDVVLNEINQELVEKVGRGEKLS